MVAIFFGKEITIFGSHFRIFSRNLVKTNKQTNKMETVPRTSKVKKKSNKIKSESINNGTLDYVSS